MRKKLIIFDFDGTLGDTRRTIVTTMQMTIKELQLPERSDDECAATIGLPLIGCFKAMFPGLQVEQYQLCADTYRRIFNENQRIIKPQAFPHVVETLSALKERGFTLTIASSRSHASLSELTKDMGISESISYLIGADDVKKAKPEPEPVLNTLSAMNGRSCESRRARSDGRVLTDEGEVNYEASETLVVGDMAVDILMGANARAKTCGVTWGNGTKKELQEAGADFIIDTMEELIEIADKI
jgi:phosphoglycolate phosphatase